MGYIAIRGWTADINRFVFKTWGDEKDPGITLDEVIRNMSGYSDLIIDIRRTAAEMRLMPGILPLILKDSVALRRWCVTTRRAG